MRLKLLQIYTFVFLHFLFLSAENNSAKITGYIYNHYGVGLSDVRVTLFDLDRYTNSDQNGYFEFLNLEKGNYSIHIEHVGYESVYLDDIIVSNNSLLELKKIILQEKIFKGDEIIISATRIERPYSDISTQVNVIDSESIKKQNAKSSAEALREEAGIFIQKTNHGGGSANIRGLSSNQILLLVDGIRLNNSTYRLGNHQYLTTVDNLMLDRIEVVRGPMSVLYGSDALGGTINLISPELYKKNNEQFKFTFLSRYASADQEKTLHGSMVATFDNLIMTVGGSYKRNEDLKRGSNSDQNKLENSTNGILQSPSGFTAYDLDTKLKYKIDQTQSIYLAFQHSRQFNVPRYDKYETGDYAIWKYEPQQRDLVYLKYVKNFNDSFFKQLQTSISYQNQQEGRKIQKYDQSILTKENDNVGTVGITLTLNQEYSNHNIITGFDIYSDHVNSERSFLDKSTGMASTDIRGKLPDNADYKSFGIFLNDEISIGNDLRLFAGTRYSYISTDFDLISENLTDNYDKSFQSFTGNAGVVYNISEYMKLKTNLGQAFRAPNLSDFSKFGESKGDIYEIPNINLEPEKLNSIDFGIYADYPGFSLNTCLFYSHINGIIESADDIYNGQSTIELNGILYQIKSKQNVGKAFIRGLETQLDLKLCNNISFSGNFTTTYGQKISAGEPVGGIPPLYGKIGLTWEVLKYYCQFYMRFAMAQNRLTEDDKDDPRIPEEGTPAWKTLNIRSGYNLTDKLYIQAAIENILDYNYREHGSGINGPGINFIFSIRYGN